MSYFAKPNFLVYDPWFDDDLEKTKIDIGNKKIKTISKIHDFFYDQSNYKVGASENNFQSNIKVNEKKIFTNNHIENTSEKYTSVSSKNFRLFEKPTKSKLNFNITKKIIYSLSIFGFVFILGFLLFFISQSKKNESNITTKSFLLEKEF
ncbi:MAG: hypothetical protein JJ848_001220 [Prochlorococcus marinus CUG1439]|uniref:hypothetical protein n=1 Tax=Prochlorococcus sp. MIT 1314 TaxID=3096220 RepID=UPI001B061987|nr:hypothetical protein [Prochlorococcus sp. MIT 1314]MCR8538959.1 hypothetical protein [Prochlorococcus marinus CUG1439]